MSHTRAQVRQQLAGMMKDYRSGTVTSADYTMIGDTARTEGSDAFNGAWLWFGTQDIEREVTDYLPDEFHFATTSPTLIPIGTAYELFSKWSPSDYHRAIDMAIRTAYPAWFTEHIGDIGNTTVADTIVICTDKLVYDLPTMTRLLDVWVENCDEYDTGTATGGTTGILTGTLIDSTKSWTTDEYAGWNVVIYDGTGAGQFMPVTSNTATTLTGSFVLNNHNWTVAPDTTSLYMIKNPDTQATDYRAIHAFRTDTRDAPSLLYLTYPYSDGMFLRLHYLSEPAVMALDTSTTDVPIEWLTYQAATFLEMMRMQYAPGNEVDVDKSLIPLYQGMADDFMKKHAMRFPSYSLRVESEVSNGSSGGTTLAGDVTNPW
jgi:hypothetical protein